MDRNTDTAAAELVRCRVMHERLRPARHQFAYRVLMVRIAASALRSPRIGPIAVDRFGLLGVRTRDFGPRDGTDVEAWLRRQLTDAAIPADGRIWLQTIPRVFGYAFNPISYFVCEDAAGHVRAIYADVNNTFGEHHGYLLAAPGGRPITRGDVLVCRKHLHVSPFCRVEGSYAFRISESARRSVLCIDYHDAKGLLIRTTLAGVRSPLTLRGALRAVLANPLMPVAVIVRIHVQALKLWRRHVPFFPKPSPPTVTISNNLTEGSTP